MAINKVVLGDQTLIDLTSDTVTADSLLEGKTAHDRSGQLITGTMSSGGSTPTLPTPSNYKDFCSTMGAYSNIGRWLMNNNYDNYRIINLGNYMYNDNLFYGCDNLTNIPEEIIINKSAQLSISPTLNYFFSWYKGNTLPKLTNENQNIDTGNNSTQYLIIKGFISGSGITSIATDYFDDWTDKRFGYGSHWFYDCDRLRNLPNTLLNPHCNDEAPSASENYYYGFCEEAYVLNEALNIPTSYLPSTTSNCFNGFMSYCHRLKNLTFGDGTYSNTDGWKNQTINLSLSVGYSNGEDLTEYGIPEGKKVTSAATYATLKNDADWWASDMAYSRYNHDSAVETLKSLPTVKSCVIKFEGAAGSATDGGAINTLTDAEIAVAAAKGWTVTLV